MALAVEFMQLHKDFMPGWEGTCEGGARSPPMRRASVPGHNDRVI